MKADSAVIPRKQEPRTDIPCSAIQRPTMASHNPVSHGAVVTQLVIAVNIITTLCVLLVPHMMCLTAV